MAKEEVDYKSLAEKAYLLITNRELADEQRDAEMNRIIDDASDWMLFQNTLAQYIRTLGEKRRSEKYDE